MPNKNMNIPQWINTDRPFYAWVPAIMWAMTLSVLSLLPYNVKPPLTIGHFDKLCHFGAYSFFAFLLVWGIKRSQRKPKARYIAFALILSAAYGMLMEIFQGYVPGRHPCFFDVVFNIAGASVGAFFGKVFLWRK